MITSHKNLYDCLGLAVVLLICLASGADAAITEVGHYDMDGDTSATEVLVLGDYAYVTSILGLATFNVSDPTNPVKIHFETAPAPNWSTIHYTGDGFLYLTCTSGGFHTLDFSDPEAPDYITSLDIDDRDAEDATIWGDYAFVIYGLSGLRVVSMNATRDVLSEHYHIAREGADRWYGIDNDGTYVYCAMGREGLKIRTIASLIGETNVVTGEIDFGNEDAKDVYVVGDWAFVCCGNDGIYVVDVSDRENPVLHATNNTPGTAMQAYVSGDYLYVADEAGGLRIFDISGLPLGEEPPYALAQTDYYDPNGDPAETYRGVFASNEYVYIADRAQGLRVLNAATRNMDMQRSFPRMEWSMMGIPTTVTTGDADALFGTDDFGDVAPGNTRWRVSRWDDSEQSYIRYQEADNPVVGDDDEPDDFAPGKGYWVIQNVMDNCILDIDENQNNGIVSQVSKYSVALEPGRDPSSYSQVANPFHYPYDLGTTYFNVSGVGELLWSNAGDYINQNAYTWDGIQHITIEWDEYINPWVGFWVVQTDHTKTISILFSPRDGYAGAPPNPKDHLPLKVADYESWTLDLPIVSTDGSYRDEFNRIRIGEDYNDVYDPYDAFEMTPMSFRFVQLYFPHEDWEVQPAKYTFDFRSLDFGESRTKTWDMTARAWRLPEEEFAISWPNIDQVPVNYSLELVDPESGDVLVDMRESESYVFSVGDQNDETVSFRIAVTQGEAFVSNETYPSDFRLLSVYPNPFNNEIRISYHISDTEPVRMMVTDVNGREVVTLVEGIQAKGTYSLAWQADGVASGSYYIRLETGANIVSERVTLMR